MRRPRMTTRRWMIATAFVAVLCSGILRAQAFMRRASFHGREKQICLQQALDAEKAHQWMKERGGDWCGSRLLLIEIAEDYESVPDLRERAAYHAELEAMYRRAARYPWIRVPAEKPFIPDDRIRSPEWLRAKAEAYRSLETVRREFANCVGSSRAQEQIRIAEEHARTATDYERRASLAQQQDRPRR